MRVVQTTYPGPLSHSLNALAAAWSAEGHFWSAASLRAFLARHRAVDFAVQPSSTMATSQASAPPPLQAWALFSLAEPEAELLFLYTERTSRRQGLGRSLLHAALNALDQRGVTTCHLEVRATDPSAIALYRAAGFAVVRTRRAYYAPGPDGQRDDAWIMARTTGG